MPLIDLSTFNIASDNRKAQPKTIDLDAMDITDRQDLDEDTLRLSEEPEFPADLARDREVSPIEALVHTLPYGPIRAIDPTRIHTKWRLFEQLTPTIPLNEYELPTYVYRPDMLDHRFIADTLLSLRNGTPVGSQPSEEASATAITQPHSAAVAKTVQAGIQDIQAQLDAAMVPLHYYEGFPALETGTPFWSQLTYEPKDAFDAFISYLECGPTRTLQMLSAFPHEDVIDWFHTYYWGTRVRAFELFRVVNANKLKISRMLQTEDSHYMMADKLLNTVNSVLSTFDGDAIKEVGFEKLVGILEKLVKVQRISVGLNANGGSNDENAGKSAPTTNVLLQQIVANSPQKRQESVEEFNILDDNPDAIDLAQELIIKTQMNKVYDQ